VTEAKRYVFLDPDGTGTDQDWMFVVVAAPTGVVYRTQELLVRLRKAVAVHLYGSANGDDTWPSPLVLDESRLAEADEAWLPVLTPDGPGSWPGRTPTSRRAPRPSPRVPRGPLARPFRQPLPAVGPVLALRARRLRAGRAVIPLRRDLHHIAARTSGAVAPGRSA
jgi:hypothetical protein